MNHFQPIGHPGRFLGLFALSTLVLLPVWSHVSESYMAGLVYLVNGALQWTEVLPRLSVPQATQGPVFPGIVAGVALFIALPARSIGWKVRWLTGLAVLSAGVHVLALCLQVQTAFALVDPQHLERSLLGVQTLSLLNDLLKNWGSLLLNVTVWFCAVTLPADRERVLFDCARKTCTPPMLAPVNDPA